jgi:hypothetical protein
MVSNFLIAVISMLFVAGLPLIAKSVGNLIRLIETDANEEVIHKSTVH